MVKSKKYGANAASTLPSEDASQRATLFQNSFFPTLNGPTLVALAILDLVLIALHIVTGAIYDKIPVQLNIALDFSIAEFVGYAKWLVIIVLLWLISRRTRNPALLSCAVLFIVMVADDSLQLHERIGEAAVKANAVGGVGWAQAQTLAELAVWAGMAALLIPIVLLGFVKSSRVQWVPAARFLGLIAMFAVFGVVIDALHKPVADLPFGPQLADLVEDGGEMIVASIIVAHAMWLSNDTSIAS